MIFRRRLPKSKIYICSWLFIFGISFLYNEYLSYYLNTFKWPHMKCQNKETCTRILISADPQIIGDKEEILHFLTPFTIFDSDRYLYKTYNYAYQEIQPDLVIFLGDLMDEGHNAELKEFHNYVRRIFRIFLEYPNPKKNVRHIWLPGDNDIGGEGGASITDENIKRFQHAFQQPDLINFRNITFFKINRLTMNIPVFKDKREFYDTDKIFVGLSHVPLMFKPSLFVDKVITKMLPQVLFTGHEHKSMIISTDALLRQDFHIVPLTPDNNQIYKFELGVTDMYEILIPTCSYRMGTDKIGYGFAIIENNELYFTVLWSPSRFPQLISYVVVVVLFCICSFLFVCYAKCTYPLWGKLKHRCCGRKVFIENSFIAK